MKTRLITIWTDPSTFPINYFQRPTLIERLECNEWQFKFTVQKGHSTTRALKQPLEMPTTPCQIYILGWGNVLCFNLNSSQTVLNGVKIFRIIYT